MAEYREVLLRPRFELDAQAVDDFLSQVEAEGEPVAAAPLSRKSRAIAHPSHCH